jgi:hypothetical protein
MRDLCLTGRKIEMRPLTGVITISLALIALSAPAALAARLGVPARDFQASIACEEVKTHEHAADTPNNRMRACRLREPGHLVEVRRPAISGDRATVSVWTWYDNGHATNSLAFFAHDVVLRRDRSRWRVVSLEASWRS